MANYKITGKMLMPDGTTVNRGNVKVKMLGGYALTGSDVRGGVQKFLVDTDGTIADLATTGLPETAEGQAYEATYTSVDQSVMLTFSFGLTADTTWADLVPGPAVVIPTVDRVAEATTAASTAQAALAEFENAVPGTVLASISATTSFTTTNVTAGSASGDMTDLTLTFTGNGRPVDLELYLPNCKHSVGGTSIAVVLVKDGNLTDPDNQVGLVQTQATIPSAGGPSLFISRAGVVIPEGTEVTYVPNVRGTAAGTVTLAAAAYEPRTFRAISR